MKGGVICVRRENIDCRGKYLMYRRKSVVGDWVQLITSCPVKGHAPPLQHIIAFPVCPYVPRPP